MKFRRLLMKQIMFHLFNNHLSWPGFLWIQEHCSQCRYTHQTICLFFFICLDPFEESSWLNFWKSALTVRRKRIVMLAQLDNLSFSFKSVHIKCNNHALCNLFLFLMNGKQSQYYEERILFQHYRSLNTAEQTTEYLFLIIIDYWYFIWSLFIINWISYKQT